MSAEDLAGKQAALARLTRSAVWGRGDLEHVLREITETAADVIEVTRVGVWLFEEGRSAIRCRDLWQQPERLHSQGALVEARDYPRYFAALEEERTIAAHDAHRDPRTAELSAGYLTEYGVSSLIDAPIVVEGRCVGVVCHEHVGPPRRWRREDELLAGSLADVVALALEVSRVRSAEARAGRLAEELRVALRAAGMGVWRWELRTGRLSFGDEVAAIFERQPDDMPRCVAEFMEHVEAADREHLARMLDAAVEGKQTDCWTECRISAPDGGVRWARAQGRLVLGEDGRPERVVGVVSDVTERKLFDQRLARTQRLEEVGQLAGGVAHDFNNLLTVIRGNLSLLRDGDGALSPELTDIEDAARRGSQLTSQLLSFASRQPVEPRAIDVNAQMRAVFGMLHRLIGERIRVRMEHCADPAVVRIDPGQLEQVLVNLAVNARDALPNGGDLTLRTSVSERPRRVVITVSDNGIGIPADVLSRVCEPFFTTKRVGQGTGLGLSTCFGIIRQAGGELNIESEPGRGTTVEVWLPRILEPADPATHRSGRRSVEEFGRGVRVLVVEDEDAVRRSVLAALQSAGFDVEAASDGDAALGRIDSSPPHMIVTDCVMPGIAGRALVDEVRRRLGREVPALFVSGYSDEARTGAESEQWLAKPFDGEGLLRAVRTLYERCVLDPRG